MRKKKKRSRTNFENIGAGPRIRAWRKSVGLKSMDLAQQIKVSQGSLSDIENGHSNPSAMTIKSLFINTEINIAWMLTGQYKILDKGETADRSFPTTILTPGSQLLIKCNE